MISSRLKVGFAFFVGSMIVSPIGYVVGTGLGGLLHRGLTGLASHQASPTGAWFLFGGSCMSIAAMNLLLFLCLTSRHPFGLPNKTQQPTGAPSGAGG